MDMRAEVYSPLQNIAVWLGAWLYELESTDDFLDAVSALGGRPTTANGGPFIDVLAVVRAAANDAPKAATTPAIAGPGPLVRLILAGPGEAPALPAGSESAEATAHSGVGSIVVSTGNPDFSLILVPHRQVTPGSASEDWAWQIIEERQPLPAPAWLNPGEADELLSRATDEAATIIEASGYRSNALSNPRLAVGTLADFYDVPGLPQCVPPRAAKLFARADRVAAIIETVTDRIDDHSLDPQLLALWRHIRAARMAGVAYAVTEFAREN